MIQASNYSSPKVLVLGCSRLWTYLFIDSPDSSRFHCRHVPCRIRYIFMEDWLHEAGTTKKMSGSKLVCIPNGSIWSSSSKIEIFSPFQLTRFFPSEWLLLQRKHRRTDVSLGSWGQRLSPVVCDWATHPEISPLAIKQFAIENGHRKKFDLTVDPLIMVIFYISVKFTLWFSIVDNNGDFL